MIPPTKCPICKHPLINEFGRSMGKSTSFGSETLTKACRWTINHTLQCHGLNQVERMVLCIGGKTIHLLPISQTLFVSNETSVIHLPYFEPNFNNFQAFLDKINFYLVFS